jgi:hypothetical protein
MFFILWWLDANMRPIYASNGGWHSTYLVEAFNYAIQALSGYKKVRVYIYIGHWYFAINMSISK